MYGDINRGKTNIHGIMKMAKRIGNSSILCRLIWENSSKRRHPTIRECPAWSCTSLLFPGKDGNKSRSHHTHTNRADCTLQDIALQAEKALSLFS